MALTIRVAASGDLDAIVRLTAQNRRRLAEWSPRWWHPSTAADQIHRLWLRHLIDSDDAIVRVAEDSGDIVGCVAAMPQANQWVIDDLAIASDDRWVDAGAALLNAIDEQPAVICAATADQARIDALRNVGLTHVSCYWIRETTLTETSTRPIWDSAAIPDPPPHTFGWPLDPDADGALAFTLEQGGLAVGSPPLTAPPVYDPGGTVCIIDRLVDADNRLIQAVLGAAAQRGDVLVNAITAADDKNLSSLLSDSGFQRTVDVLRWP